MAGTTLLCAAQKGAARAGHDKMQNSDADERIKHILWHLLRRGTVPITILSLCTILDGRSERCPGQAERTAREFCPTALSYVFYFARTILDAAKSNHFVDRTSIERCTTRPAAIQELKGQMLRRVWLRSRIAGLTLMACA